MALVLALTLSTALLVFAGFYITQIRQQAPLNYPILTSLQANFLAQGVAQIAALKVKKFPGPLYYAFIAKTKNNNPGPWNNFVYNDPSLKPNVTTPFTATVFPEIIMGPSQIYKNINLKLQVQVSIQDPHGNSTTRVVEQYLNGEIEN